MTMYILRKSRRFLLPLFAGVCLLSLFACSADGSLPPQNSEQLPLQSALKGQTEQQMSSPQQTYNVQTDNGVINGITPPDNSAKSPGTGENAKSAVQPAESEPKWDTDVPMLAGIAIGDIKESVKQRLVAPSDEYTLEDDDEVTHVSDYNGFSIGYDKTDLVKFVEVYDPGVKTGLNGLRIGFKEDAALKALGKPSSHTTYVLSYKAKGALLKLDIDPKKREILSIKLFKH